MVLRRKTLSANFSIGDALSVSANTSSIKFGTDINVSNAEASTTIISGSDALTTVNPTAPSVPIFLDETATNYSGTVNSSDSSTGDFNFTVAFSGTRHFSNKLPSGKKYFEINFASGAVGLHVAVVHESFNGDYRTGGANMHYQFGGNLWPGNSATGLGSWYTYPELLRIAYDTETGKFWFGANDKWSSQGGNPEAGGAGLTLYNFGTYGDDDNYRVVMGFNYASGALNPYIGQFLFGNNITLSVPTGFTVV